MAKLDKSKVAICYPNYLDRGMIAGGSYLPSLPLMNAANPVFAKKARTTDTMLSSTRFDVTFDRERICQAFVIASHNFTSTARVNIKLYRDVAKTMLLYETMPQPVYPGVPTDQLEWEQDNFWFGTPDSEILERYSPLFFFFTEDAYFARVVEFEIYDESNMFGYVEFGRVFVSDVWQPEINMDYGVQFSHKINTQIEEAISGTEYFDVNSIKRTLEFQLSGLTEEEAFNRIYTIQKTLGVNKEILVAYNPESTALNQNNIFRTFLARQQAINPLTHPFLNRFSNTLSFLEIV